MNRGALGSSLPLHRPASSPPRPASPPSASRREARIQGCRCSSSPCSPRSCCGTWRLGAPASSTPSTAPTDATRSGAAGRSAAHEPCWMTAAVARSAPPAEGSTATARCPACTESSADPGYSASSTRMRTITGTSTASAEVPCACPWTLRFNDVAFTAASL